LTHLQRSRLALVKATPQQRHKRPPVTEDTSSVNRNMPPDPQHLSATDVLWLQNRLGNRAVTRMLRDREIDPSQRRDTGSQIRRALLPTEPNFQTLNLADERLVAIGEDVVRYNEVANLVTEEGYQQRFTRLQAVERAVYRWFTQVSTDNRRRSGNAYTERVNSNYGRVR